MYSTHIDTHTHTHTLYTPVDTAAAMLQLCGHSVMTPRIFSRIAKKWQPYPSSVIITYN